MFRELKFFRGAGGGALKGTGLIWPGEEVALGRTCEQPASAYDELVKKMKPGSSGGIVGGRDTMCINRT